MKKRFAPRTGAKSHLKKTKHYCNIALIPRTGANTRFPKNKTNK